MKRESLPDLRGKRVLVVEDEPLVAMAIEQELNSLGVDVVGPAGTIQQAQQFIDEVTLHAALLDANIAGEPVDGIAASLTQKRVPFAFASGYGREALPLSFRQAPLLMKPFDTDQLRAVVELLLNPDDRSPGHFRYGRKGP